MPRRRNHTDSSTPATPTRPELADLADPTGPTPEPLPRAPVPPSSPRLEPARPGRRADQPSENAVTKRLEKLPVEITPAPLPPSPGAVEAERWFEQIPTNPGAPRREPSSVREAIRTPPRGVPTMLPAPGGARLLTGLIVATALAVGMVLGALLFSHRGTTRCAPCTTGSGSAAAPSSVP
jgi:hypothetical protein